MVDGLELQKYHGRRLGTDDVVGRAVDGLELAEIAWAEARDGGARSSPPCKEARDGGARLKGVIRWTGGGRAVDGVDGLELQK